LPGPEARHLLLIEELAVFLAMRNNYPLRLGGQPAGVSPPC